MFHIHTWQNVPSVLGMSMHKPGNCWKEGETERDNWKEDKGAQIKTKRSYGGARQKEKVLRQPNNGMKFSRNIT